MKTAILGSGAWGTTLAILLHSAGAEVSLWDYNQKRAEAMRVSRENTESLRGTVIPDSVLITAEAAEALQGAEIALFVVPAQKMRENIRAVRQDIPIGAYVVTASKGIELTTLCRMSQIAQEELPEPFTAKIAALSGPNLAAEIAAGQPAAAVVASANIQAAEILRDAFNAPLFRVYSTDDSIGVELGGALKNVLAIAIGALDGLKFGVNAKAALMTRGIAEIGRLAVAEGAHHLTLAGLAGLGDVIATCSSPLSRNYSLGFELTSSGDGLEAILQKRHSVTEGVATSYAALEMARRNSIEMPIARAVCDLFEGRKPIELVEALLRRERRAERDT